MVFGLFKKKKPNHRTLASYAREEAEKASKAGNHEEAMKIWITAAKTSHRPDSGYMMAALEAAKMGQRDRSIKYFNMAIESAAKAKFERHYEQATIISEEAAEFAKKAKLKTKECGFYEQAAYYWKSQGEEKKYQETMKRALKIRNKILPIKKKRKKEVKLTA